MQNKLLKEALVIGIAIILICVAPLVYYSFNAPEAEEGQEVEMFGGADGAAEEAIGEINEGYEPWFEPICEPNSGEIESLLFSLQVALGAIFIGYAVGVIVERRRHTKKS